MAAAGSPPKRPHAFFLLVSCFFASGFAALIYQTAWTRQFSFVFGTSELAVATVLAAYMGGLAIGAAVAARWAPRIRKPVLIYGLLELGIAIAAVTVPFGILAARAIYVASFGASPTPPSEAGMATALFYLSASFLILLVPTSLMGATLPLLARHAVRRDQEIGSGIGLLYAFNTAGAVVGTVLTGFVLLPGLGLSRTIGIAILANFGVFVIAALLARRVPWLPRSDSASEQPSQLQSSGRWILPLILASGAASFAYEVLWSRLLGHILGGSTYAFSTMLGTFLTGIALGSWAASRVATTPERSIRLFAWAQLGTGALFLLAYHLLNHLPDFSRSLMGWSSSAPFADAVVSAAVLLPGTFCVGATFPLAVRIFTLKASRATEGTGRVYSWNTAGAILGSIGAGFFLIPIAGYTVTIQFIVLANLVIAGLCALRITETPRPALWITSAAILLVLVFPPSPPWNLLRNTPLAATSLGGNLTYFGVGRSSTVMLRDRQGRWHLSSNGLPEAVILPRGGLTAFSTASQWLANAPVLARPEMRSVLLVGLGGGVTIENIPASVESIDVIEIEPEIVAANRAVARERTHDPLADRRVQLTINDVRSALLLSEKSYDAIISQPSHPWTAGASHLYTREFFELARDHLSDDGVLVQWMGLGYVDTDLLRILVATLLEVFPHVGVYQPTPGDVLMLASDAPLDLEEQVAEALVVAPDNLAHLGISGPEDIGATWILDTEGARQFAQGAPINTDDHNHLQARSPRLAPGGATGSRIEMATRNNSPLSAIPPEWDAVYLVRRTSALGFSERAQRIAAAIEDPNQRRVAQGLVAYSQAKWETAATLLQTSLANDPSQDEARVALWRLRGQRDPVSHPASDNVALVMEAAERRKRNDWAGLEEMDGQLAAATPHDPQFPDASQLRAEWRVEAGDPQHAREAMTLLDQMGPLVGGPRTLLTRARAAAQAGHARAVVQTLFELSVLLDPSNARDRMIAGDALTVLEGLPRSASPPSQLARLERRLGRIAATSAR